MGSRPAGGIARLRFPVNFVTSTNPAADVPETGARGPTAFATTHWSLIVRAADGGTTEGRAALAELCQIYWYPLYGFARRRGLAPANARTLRKSSLTVCA